MVFHLLALIALLALHTNVDAHAPLRILMLVFQYPRLETFVVNEAKGLCDAGHEVHILAQWQFAGEDQFKGFPIAGIYYKELPRDAVDYDIIYCEFSFLASDGLALKQKGINGKLVVNFRGGDTALNANTPEERAFHHQLAQEADGIIVVCQAFKKRLLDLGYPENKIILIHSGIDCSKFAFAPRTINPDQKIELISVGRFVEQKGFEDAIKAVALVAGRNPNIHFTIIGSGDLEDRCKLLARQLGCNHVITFAGQKSPHEVAQLLQKSHIFILPSVTAADGRCEGIPDSLKEAMGCGLPVVSTWHTGIPELVEHNVSGVLVNERNVLNLYEQIEHLVRHPDLWQPMGAAGHLKVLSLHNLRVSLEQLNNYFLMLAHA